MSEQTWGSPSTWGELDTWSSGGRVGTASVGAYGDLTVEQANEGSTRVILTVHQPAVATVTRWDDDRLVPQVLAGGDHRTMPDETTIVLADSAPRLGGPTYYQATLRVNDVDYAATVTVELPFPTPVEGCYPAVLNDPVNPGLIAVCSWGGGDQPIDLEARGALFDVIGRRDRVAIGGVRSSAAGTMTLLTHTTNQAEALRGVLASGRVVLIRIPEEADPGHALFYAQIGTVGVTRTIPDVRRPERRWSVPYTTVAEPDTEQMTKVGNTWQDVKDGNATWQALRDRNATWLSVINDPSVVAP